jgi:uncharacterized coiled-coil protein SlyX
MLDNDFDPYAMLEGLQLSDMSQDQQINELQGRLKEQAHLMELLANQVKHLTNAVIGLQNQSKLTISRVERLEGIDLD